MEIRAITDDEVPAFLDCVMTTFGVDASADAVAPARFRALVDPTRAYVAIDGGQIVATSATFDLELAVPGGSLAMAGLTMVTVRPTHRRRGLLRTLVGEHLAAATRKGQAISGLWASDASIYRRFGYGIAAEGDELKVGTPLDLPDAIGRDAVVLISDDEALRLLPPILERARATRPGLLARTEAWWRYRRILDRPELRAKGIRRHVVARRSGPGSEVGYVTFRQKLGWDDSGHGAGTVEIEEMIGLDAQAEASLWRFVTSIDLFPKVSWWNAPLDCMLPHLIADPRLVQRHPSDTLWLRPGDVAAVLAARRYSIDGEICLAVFDGTDRAVGSAPIETYRLRVDHGSATCVRDDAPADLHLDRAALGAIYLGGAAPRALARAGRITGSDDAVARAASMFVADAAPWCAEVF